MHFILYVCLPTEEAKTSLQARRRVCRYLEEEHFDRRGRFCGHCDYFRVGGHYSGILNRLRLARQQPQKFREFLRKYEAARTRQGAIKLFKKFFPHYDGMNPFDRPEPDFYGHPDDAQIMDEVLFTQLKDGFNEYVTHAVPFEEPNVIFTDIDETEWPNAAKGAVGRHWVVVIDYHD